MQRNLKVKPQNKDGAAVSGGHFQSDWTLNPD